MKNRWTCLIVCVLLLFGGPISRAGDMEIDIDAGIIRFESPGYINISARLPLKDGTLLITVIRGDDTQKNEQASYTTTLFRLSAEGRVLWARTLGEEDGHLRLRLLCETDDGSVLAVAEHSVSQVTQYRQFQGFSIEDGSLLWSGDKEEVQKGVSETILPLNEGYLRETIYNADRHTEPRYYELYTADRTALWKVDEAQTVRTLHEVLTTPKGTLLLGKNLAEDIQGYRACAALVDDAGQVVWKREYGELGNSFFRRGAVSSTGELAAIALVGGMGEERKHLLVSMDADSGELRRLAAFSTEDLYVPILASSGSGWVVGGTSSYGESAPYLRFVEIDAKGNITRLWDTSYEGEQVFSPCFFNWNNALWVNVTIHLSDSQISWLQRTR